MLGEFIKIFKSYLGLKRKVKDSFWFRKIRYLGLDKSNLEVHSSGSSLIIETFDFRIPNESFGWVLDGLSYFKNIHTVLKPKYYFDNNGLIFEFNNIKLKTTSKQELLIVKEIFSEGIYNCIIPQATIVIDIGMNVGFSALFFAQNDRVKKVYGFEPFKPTFILGQENLQMNPKIRGKIICQNIGLGDKNETLTLKYSLKNKGSVSTVFETSKIPNRSNDFQTEQIEIRAADEVLSNIFNNYPGSPFVLKIDCEGCEYQVFQALSKANMLIRFDIIICEWHQKGPKELIETLEKNGFHIFSINNHLQIGMIYASKKGRN